MSEPTPRPTCGDCAHWHELPPDPKSGQTQRTGQCMAAPPLVFTMPPRPIEPESEVIQVGGPLRVLEFSPPILRMQRPELPATFPACDEPVFRRRAYPSRVEAIQVWRFHEAPAGLQTLSRHGGDEDWLAVVPPGWDGGDGDKPAWMSSNTPFGYCEVSAHHQPDGSVVYIGAHA